MKVKQKRGIWKNLGWALACTPMVLIGGLIIISIVGTIDNEITKIQIAEHWWILLIIGYVVSLIYVYYEPKVRQNRERNKLVSALILYWKSQFSKQNKPMPSEDDIETIRKLLIERLKVWAKSNPKLWARYYPEEKYSDDPFEIIDVLIKKNE